MKFSKWLVFSMGTLVISVLITYCLALVLKSSDIFVFFGFGESQSGGWYLFVLGLLFGAISLALFFSYQFLQYIALQMLGRWLWNAVQVLLVVVAYIDVAYLRWTNFPAEQEVSFFYFLDWPTILLGGAVAGSWLKVKLTNNQALIPSLFYLMIGTLIGAFYAFKTYDHALILFVVAPIFSSNVWQLIALPYYLAANKKNQTESV